MFKFINAEDRHIYDIYPKVEFNQKDDDYLKDDVDVLWLVKDLNNNEYHITPYTNLINNGKILESFVVCRKCVNTLKHLSLLNEILSKFNNDDDEKSYGFIKICQNCCIPYAGYPFDFKASGSFYKYLTNDEEEPNLPLLSDLKNFKKLVHWKYVYHVSEYEANCYGARHFQSWYETFATKWIEYRIALRGSVYLPYEVLSSLNESKVCSMAHAFIEGFRIARSFDAIRCQCVYELFKQWISDHKNELQQVDVNNKTPLAAFNTWYPTHDYQGNEVDYTKITAESIDGRIVEFGKIILAMKELMHD